MSIIQSDLLLGQEGSSKYQVSRSLRFNSADSAYLSRTPASAGNRKTWTWSGWVKRTSSANSAQSFFSAYIGSGSVNNEFFSLTFANDAISVNGYSTPILVTSSVYRDFSAWYHVVLAVDTTNGTSSERVKLWVNGVLVTAFQSTSYPSLNADLAVNLNSLHTIGKWSGFTGAEFDGYLADVYLLDGTATTPSTFAETDAITGQWVPKTPTGISYGTNGFRLSFSDNSGTTSTTLGKDSAGSNNWSPNNFSVASGSGNDSLTDSPTSYGTGNSGGDVRGNYATLNPLDKGANISVTDGNLTATVTSTGGIVLSTFGVSSGKWYWEMERNGGTDCVIGIARAPVSKTAYLGSDANGWGYIGGSGNKVNNASSVAYGTAYASGVVVGVALDMDAGTVTFYRNGTSQGTAYSGLTGTIFPAFGTGNNTDSVFANFGQRAFAYTAPSGFKALVDTNLTAPVIAKPSTVMDIALWTGNSTNGRAITGLAFQPEFVWIKRRSASYNNILSDAVRGFGSTGWAKQLISDSTAAEDTGTVNTISSFDTGGFTLGVDGGVNFSGSTYVGWCWDAGTSTVTNTQGSITSSVRANASAGFSIVSYTGTGSTATVGHGLNVAPSLIICKTRAAAVQWVVYHASLGKDAFLGLNTTDASITFANYWGSGVTSTVFGLQNLAGGNNNGSMIAYCFAPVSGYSSFGSHVGNGSSDGVFVYTGFRPKFVLIKRTNTAEDWVIVDASRSTYNVTNLYLLPSSSGAEGSTTLYDFVSNGIKFRGVAQNENGSTYVWAAFAEAPFQYARAR